MSEASRGIRQIIGVAGAVGAAVLGPQTLYPSQAEALTLHAGKDASVQFMRQVRATDQRGYLPSPKGVYVVNHDAVTNHCPKPDMGVRGACVILGLNEITLDSSLQGGAVSEYLGNEKGHIADEAMAVALGNKFSDVDPGLRLAVNSFRTKMLVNTGVARDRAEAERVIAYGPDDPNLSPGERTWYTTAFTAALYGRMTTYGPQKDPKAPVTVQFNSKTTVKMTAKQYNKAFATMKWQLQNQPAYFESPDQVLV